MSSFISEFETENNLIFVIVNCIQHDLSRRLSKICRNSLRLFQKSFKKTLKTRFFLNFKTLAK